jgi:hypothetical protein
MLPALADRKPSTNRIIGKGVLEELYGCVRKAAIRVVHAGEVGHWLPTYDAELRRARKTSGQLQTSGRLIPPFKNREFAAELMRNLGVYAWGDEAFRPQGKSCNLSKLVLTRSRLLKIMTEN